MNHIMASGGVACHSGWAFKPGKTPGDFRKNIHVHGVPTCEIVGRASSRACAQVAQQ
jgi:hypothetical protein